MQPAQAGTLPVAMMKYCSRHASLHHNAFVARRTVISYQLLKYCAAFRVHEARKWSLRRPLKESEIVHLGLRFWLSTVPLSENISYVVSLKLVSNWVVSRHRCRQSRGLNHAWCSCNAPHISWLTQLVISCYLFCTLSALYKNNYPSINMIAKSVHKGWKFI